MFHMFVHMYVGMCEHMCMYTFHVDNLIIPKDFNLIIFDSEMRIQKIFVEEFLLYKYFIFVLKQTL